MMSCEEAARHIARSAGLDEQSSPDLQAHLATCAPCLTALEGQRAVARMLRGRPADHVSPGFTARLNARLEETGGWFGLADWRAWTFRLSPVAVALALAAFLTSGDPASSPTLADWTMSGAESSTNAALLWQPDATTEAVLETMLTGGNGLSTAEGGDVR